MSEDREARAHLQTIDERDAAEEALSQAYYLVTGRSPEWSNVFGHAQALEDIDDACTSLRLEIKRLQPKPRAHELVTDDACKLLEREAASPRSLAVPQEDQS